MKHFIIGCLCLLLFGCGTSVNLTEEREVKRKLSYPEFTKYYIGNNWKEWCNTITADDDFADVGDIIKCVNGKIIVIKKEVE